VIRSHILYPIELRVRLGRMAREPEAFNVQRSAMRSLFTVHRSAVNGRRSSYPDVRQLGRCKAGRFAYHVERGTPRGPAFPFGTPVI
jgi:hypothetical protein